MRRAEVDHVGVQKYGYTYSDEGDPLTQSNLTTPIHHEEYTYDGMHRLATINRGLEPGSVNPAAGLAASGSFQSWNLDKVGNWISGTTTARTRPARTTPSIRKPLLPSAPRWNQISYPSKMKQRANAKWLFASARFVVAGVVAAFTSSSAFAAVTESVKNPHYGVQAVGNGVTDDTVGIQACIDYVSNNGGGTVLFPPGIYLVSPQTTLRDGTNWNLNPGGGGNTPCPMSCLAVFGNTTLQASNPSLKPTIKIKNNPGRYHSIIAPKWWLSDGNFSNFHVYNLIVDGNSAHNPRYQAAVGVDDINATQFALFYPIYGTSSNSVIQNCTFQNFACVQVLNCQNSSFSNWTVDNCTFSNIGGPTNLGGGLANWYDHSTIYTGALNCTVSNCHFYSPTGTGGQLGCVTAMEMHGPVQYCRNNDVHGFAIGANAVADPVASNAVQQYTINKFYHCLMGVNIWPISGTGFPHPSLSSVLIDSNQVYIDVAAWRQYMTTSNCWPKNANGVRIDYGCHGNISGLTISNNIITYDRVSTGVYDDANHGGDKYSSGILLMSSPTATDSILYGVDLRGNTINYPLSNGIQVAKVVRYCHIASNTITNPGTSSLVSGSYTAAIKLAGDQMDGVWVPGSLAMNVLRDLRTTKRMRYGLYASSAVGTTYSLNHYRTSQATGLVPGGSSFHSTLGGNSGWNVQP